MMEELGLTLKNAREEKGISLAEIAEGTKIHRRYLELMEKGAFDQLPGTVYARAFLRHYARAVGLDPEYVIDEYHKRQSAKVSGAREETSDGTLSVSGYQERLRRRREKRARQKSWAIALVSLLAVSVAGFYVAGELGRKADSEITNGQAQGAGTWDIAPDWEALLAFEPEEEVDRGEDPQERNLGDVESVEAPDVVDGDLLADVLDASMAAGGGEMAQPGQAIDSIDSAEPPGESEGAHASPEALQTGGASPDHDPSEATAETDADPLESGGRALHTGEAALETADAVIDNDQGPAEENDGFALVDAGNPEAGVASPAEASDELMGVVLLVEVVETCWFDVIADGRRIFTGILEPGAEATWVADELLQVRFGRPEGVFLTLNGEPLGRAGTGVITREFRKDGTS